MLDAVFANVTSSTASRYSAVKLTTDSYQFRVAHVNLRVTFKSHVRFGRKVQKYGDAFSKSSSIIEPQHEISNNVVCATSKRSDQPAHTRRLIRAFDSRLNNL